MQSLQTMRRRKTRLRSNLRRLHDSRMHFPSGMSTVRVRSPAFAYVRVPGGMQANLPHVVSVTSSVHGLGRAQCFNGIHGATVLIRDDLAQFGQANSHSSGRFVSRATIR
jgi:hypothetical protein